MSYRQSPLRASGGGSGRSVVGPVVAGVVFLAVVAVGLYLWQPWSSSGKQGGSKGVGGGSSSSEPKSQVDRVAAAFATGWTKHDFSSVAFANGVTSDAVAGAYDAIVKSLDATAVSVVADNANPVPGNDDAERATLHVAWTLPGGQVWKYDSSVELDDTDGDWAVTWSPSVIEPGLVSGDTLRYTRIDPKRSTILDGAGQPLMTDQPVVDIGVEPSKTTDATATATQLAAALKAYGIDATSLASRITSAPADQFVDVITLRQADFTPVQAGVSAVPGVILHDLTEQLSPSHDFARSLLGTVGPVTKEIVDASKGRYVAGDNGGLSGLEKEFDATIGGTPGYEIDAVHASVGGSTPLPTKLASVPAVDGQPLRTTIDQNVQNAADAALSTITDQPSALVAVRVSTGQVIAVANGPAGGGYDNALLAQVPPGSAFKIVTTTALLEGGLNVNTPVQCPQNIVVQGKSFHNYEGETLPDPPFSTDFAQSCNTAFISLASKVKGTALPDAARALGVGACWSLGTDAFTGSVPEPKTDVDLAAAAFGQGQTLVSPVSLAVAAATVARGSYVAPALVLNGNPTSSSCSGSSAASASPAQPAALPASDMTQLRTLMREVVTSGTATVLASAPGGPVMAKTGTAEYGGGANPKTHAWLIGYQGDIAFAVYVQDGQSGGTVAAPVALKFLRNLAAK